MSVPHPFPLFHPDDCYHRWPRVASTLNPQGCEGQKDHLTNISWKVKVKQAGQGPPAIRDLSSEYSLRYKNSPGVTECRVGFLPKPYK